MYLDPKVLKYIYILFISDLLYFYLIRCHTVLDLDFELNFTRVHWILCCMNLQGEYNILINTSYYQEDIIPLSHQNVYLFFIVSVFIIGSQTRLEESVLFVFGQLVEHL